ncbi:MAG: hypothetical protein AAF610_11685 [Pseudomonadota bacterium]
MSDDATTRRGWADWLSVMRTSVLVLVVTFFGQLGASLDDLSLARVLAVLTGLAVLLLVVLAGYALAFAVPSRLPDIFWVSAAATLAGMPFIPESDAFIAALSELSFVAMITPVLAFVALGLTGREVALFRRTGLQVIVISVLVFAGTFIGSAVVAHWVLRLTGSAS